MNEGYSGGSEGGGGKGGGKGGGGRVQGPGLFGGHSATLLRRECLVEPAPPERFPVYTLTFRNPDALSRLGMGVNIGTGDVVKVCVPNYKPKSYSMSAAREGEFDITFKVYPGGRASGYLDSIAVGQSIDVFPMGKKARHPGAFVGLVAFGVGITEALPLAAIELSEAEAESVRLLWCSKSSGDTFWREWAARLAATYPGRFELVDTFTREDVPGARRGRVDAATLREVFDGVWGTLPGGENEVRRGEVRFTSVGTKEMMRAFDVTLGEVGYPMPAHALLKKPGE